MTGPVSDESATGTLTRAVPIAPGEAWSTAPEGVALIKDRPLTFTMVSDQGSCESTSAVE